MWAGNKISVGLENLNLILFFSEEMGFKGDIRVPQQVTEFTV